MEGVDDRIEHAAARVTPSRRVQRHRKLAGAAPAQGLERLDELQEASAVVQPALAVLSGQTLTLAVSRELWGLAPHAGLEPPQLLLGQ
jgi:hypothetical protein